MKPSSDTIENIIRLTVSLLSKYLNILAKYTNERKNSSLFECYEDVVLSIKICYQINGPLGEEYHDLFKSIIAIYETVCNGFIDETAKPTIDETAKLTIDETAELTIELVKETYKLEKSFKKYAEPFRSFRISLPAVFSTNALKTDIMEILTEYVLNDLDSDECKKCFEELIASEANWRLNDVAYLQMWTNLLKKSNFVIKCGTKMIELCIYNLGKEESDIPLVLSVIFLVIYNSTIFLTYQHIEIIWDRVYSNHPNILSYWLLISLGVSFSSFFKTNDRYILNVDTVCLVFEKILCNKNKLPKKDIRPMSFHLFWNFLKIFNSNLGKHDFIRFVSAPSFDDINYLETFQISKTVISKTATSETAISKTATSETAISKTATSKTATSETAISETAISETATSETAIPETALPETATSETAIPKTAISGRNTHFRGGIYETVSIVTGRYFSIHDLDSITGLTGLDILLDICQNCDCPQTFQICSDLIAVLVFMNEFWRMRLIKKWKSNLLASVFTLLSETARNETAENKTNVNETAKNETAVNKTNVNETAKNETAVNKTNVNETAGSETAENKTAIHETAEKEIVVTFKTAEDLTRNIILISKVLIRLLTYHCSSNIDRTFLDTAVWPFHSYKTNEDDLKNIFKKYLFLYDVKPSCNSFEKEEYGSVLVQFNRNISSDVEMFTLVKNSNSTISEIREEIASRLEVYIYVYIYIYIYTYIYTSSLEAISSRISLIVELEFLTNVNISTSLDIFRLNCTSTEPYSSFSKLLHDGFTSYKNRYFLKIFFRSSSLVL
eukprot:GHVL01029213.1.p1 GENE.GHVL01029213.1~~GHVL01029213.1.p1  ORF type:complete len:822 (+),score=193.35 GHVL01029213.1:88-2466(+)